jgi:hypothetical protein
VSRRGGPIVHKNAETGQTKVEFNLSSNGGQNESRVNAESQAAAPEEQETHRRRSQAGEAAGEGGIGGAEEGEGEEGESEERER